MKILIVDDDTLILEILTLYLGTIDYTDVHCAENATTALTMIKEASPPFECILLDISMPVLTGIELIPMIRECKGYAETPIIMMTALNDRHNITSAFVAGAFDYVTKPCEFFELETQLQAAKIRGEEMFFRPGNSLELSEDVDKQVKTFFTEARPDSTTAVMESGLLSETAFENCLRRIRAQSGRPPNLLTLHMRGFANAPLRHDGRESDHYLITLSRNIAKMILPLRGIAAYLGDSTFIVVSFGAGRSAQSDLADAIRRAVSLTNQSYRNDGGPEPMISVSSGGSEGTVTESDSSYLVYTLKQDAKVGETQSS
jgi:DNA-binding response OmpR family regulator